MSQQGKKPTETKERKEEEKKDIQLGGLDAEGSKEKEQRETGGRELENQLHRRILELAGSDPSLARGALAVIAHSLSEEGKIQLNQMAEIEKHRRQKPQLIQRSNSDPENLHPSQVTPAKPPYRKTKSSPEMGKPPALFIRPGHHPSLPLPPQSLPLPHPTRDNKTNSN